MVAGHPARVPPGVCVYAIGDIHGRADLLADMHRLIIEDAAHITPGTNKVVLYLGDYVDRGPASREVIDLLMNEGLPEVQAVHLLGNHDAWLLSFLVDPTIGPTWLRYGGEATGINARVVSAPSLEWFAEQDEAYRESVLPKAVTARVSVEAGSVLSWRGIVGDRGRSIGIDHFGASADYKTLFQKFGITAEAVVEAARESIKENA